MIKRPCSARVVRALVAAVLLHGVGATFAPRLVSGAEITDITSALDVGDAFDAHVSLAYRRTHSRGAIRRERVGRDPDQSDIQLTKELRFSQVRHELSPRLEIGLWKDLQLHLELPVVVADSRSLDFEQNGGDSCGTPREQFCVSPRNSSLARDGLLDGAAMDPSQVAVANSDGPPGGRKIPTRSGIDQLFLGLTWAPWNQVRDPAKPTWLIGFESRVAVGPTMDYAPTEPRANQAVGHGVHQFHFFTTVSRRFDWLDPWFGLYYLLPLARADSLFERTTFTESGQEQSGPRHRAGLDVGVEIVPWEVHERGHRLSISVRGQVNAIFGGRGYSPLWELLADNPRLSGTCHPDAPNAPDLPPPWSNGTFCADKDDAIRYPGITQIENHLNFTGSLALNLRLTRFFYLQLGFSLGHDQSHFITNEDPGRPTEPSGRIDARDPLQLNPMYRPLVDTPGGRLKVEESTIFDVFFTLAGTL